MQSTGRRTTRRIRAHPITASIIGAAAVIIVVVAAIATTGHKAAASGGSAGSTAAGANPGSSGPGGGTVPVNIPISATSSSAPVTGYVFVSYGGSGGHSISSAEISGKISHAATGEVARLYAQQFPYTSAPSPAASLALSPTGGTAAYTFEVTPALATRYEVELFKNSTVTRPLARSTAITVYAVYWASDTGTHSCNGTTCSATYTYTQPEPASALATEMAKKWYPYFAVNLSSGGEPARPDTVQLGAGDPIVGAPQQVSADEFTRTVTWTFSNDGQSYHYATNTCDKDTEAQDGTGLPGSHSCGDSSVPYTISYLA